MKSNANKPGKDRGRTADKRVLVWGLTNNIAGTEGVIKNVVQACREQISFDFLVKSDVPNYAELFKSDDNRLFIMPDERSQRRAYKKYLEEHFKQYGSEYSAVWSNMCVAANTDVLELGFRYGVPRRILHCHNSRFQGSVPSRIIADCKKMHIMSRLADRWACSEAAGTYMFGGRDFEVIPNAIPFQEYRFSEADRVRIRRSLDIPFDARVVGMVGRLTGQKNHKFLLDLFAAYHQLDGMFLVLVGDGELRNALKGRAYELGLGERIRFVNATLEVASYYSSFDVLALPSEYEGLPLVLLEAQANGLPVVLSSNVPRGGEITSTATRIPLVDCEKWADAIARSSRDHVRWNERADLYNMDVQKKMLIAGFGGERC